MDIKQERLQRGLSLAQLAEQAGVSQNTVRRMEAGQEVRTASQKAVEAVLSATPIKPDTSVPKRGKVEEKPRWRSEDATVQERVRLIVGLTQDELAEKSNVSRRTVHSYLSGGEVHAQTRKQIKQTLLAILDEKC